MQKIPPHILKLLTDSSSEKKITVVGESYPNDSAKLNEIVSKSLLKVFSDDLFKGDNLSSFTESFKDKLNQKDKEIASLEVSINSLRNKMNLYEAQEGTAIDLITSLSLKLGELIDNKKIDSEEIIELQEKINQKLSGINQLISNFSSDKPASETVVPFVSQPVVQRISTPQGFIQKVRVKGPGAVDLAYSEIIYENDQFLIPKLSLSTNKSYFADDEYLF